MDDALVRLREFAFEVPFHRMSPNEMFEYADMILRKLADAADEPPGQTRPRNKGRKS